MTLAVFPDMRIESLTALDSAFLAIEDERNHMHVALTAIFEREPLTTASGQLDTDRILRYARTVMRTLPRFCSRLERVPLLLEPVLVEDPSFDPGQHLRFIELSPPGDDTQLKELVGRIYSEALDRSRPLWEQWFVDRLEGGRIAVVTKVHHCLIDGVAGIEALTSFLSPTPDGPIPAEDPPHARTEPVTRRELLTRELRHRVSGQSALLDVVRRDLHAGRLRPRELLGAARRFATTVRHALRPTSRTALNPRRIGAIRAFDGVRFPLDDVRAIKRAAGATVNDVVLAVVTGAVRRYLVHHGEDVTETRFRALVPVSLHQPGGELRNEISFMLTDLPVAEVDARARLQAIARATDESKRSGQTEALALAGALADLTVHGAIALAAQCAIRMRPFNVIVTNIPGPGIPLYLLGARLLSVYPMVPLYMNQAVGIAILSYDGNLYFGLNGDSDHMADLGWFAASLLTSFRDLQRAFPGGPAVQHAPPRAPPA
jgi:diacylglycerol O-acyltransferase / wax synthase